MKYALLSKARIPINTVMPICYKAAFKSVNLHIFDKFKRHNKESTGLVKLNIITNDETSHVDFTSV